MLSSVNVPTFEKAGQVAPSRVPIAVSASEQLTLPSAVLELIEKPLGIVTVVERISDGDAVVGLSSSGTFRSTSTPEGELSLWGGRCASQQLGLKVNCSQPVVDGQATSARTKLCV